MKDWYYAVIAPLMVWAGIWWYALRTNKKLLEAQELLAELRNKKGP